MRTQCVAKTLSLLVRNVSRGSQAAVSIDATDCDPCTLQRLEKETLRLALERHRHNLDVDLVTTFETKEGVDELSLGPSRTKRAYRCDQ